LTDGTGTTANGTSQYTPEEIERLVNERVAAEAASIKSAGGSSPARGGNGDSASAGGGNSKIDSKTIMECFYANELGDATLYARLFRDQFLFCKNSEEWYQWNGVNWQRDVMGRSLVAVEEVTGLYLSEYWKSCAEVKEMVALGAETTSIEIKQKRDLQDNLLRRVNQLRGTRRRANCLAFVHTIAQPLAITGDEFDSKPMLFPVANGVIDLETGKLLPGRPGDYLTKSSPVVWKGIDEPCPLWEQSLLEIFNGNEELVAYMRRLLGYSMTGLVTEKVFPVLYGKTGWNGRSLIMETIRKVMGDFAGSIPSEMLLSQKFGKSSSGPSPDIMGLKGVRLAFASEIDEAQRFSAARIKWLTGKDELVGRNPHDVHQTRFQPTHKLFLMTNTQPKAPPNDTAFWYRMHLIPFDISFVNRDPLESYERRANLNLDREIQKELSGILAWLVRGCLEWQRNGLMPPKAITEATARYQKREDMLADFIEECLLKEVGGTIWATDLYARFKTWYGDNIGKDPPSGTWFGTAMGDKFDKSKRNGRNIYLGITMKPFEDPEGGGGLV